MKIESIQQLKEQKILHKIRLNQLEDQIRDDFAEIKKELKPVSIVLNLLKNLVPSAKQGVVAGSVGLTVDTIIRKLLFRKTNFITKTLLSFLTTNVANNLVSKNSDNILEFVHSLINKLKDKKHRNGHYYDASTANVDL